VETSDPATAAVGRPWHILGFVLLTAAGAYAVAVSLSLGLWRQNSPGVGLFPFIAASLVTVFSLGSLAGVLRPRAGSAPPAGTGTELRATLLRVGAYLAALIFYAASLDALGFSVATVLVVTFILRLAEGYSWRTTLALAIGTAAVCHVLFVRWLGAILPAGYLWDGMFF
jgi:putative tricarboxylic transport membrane protein